MVALENFLNSHLLGQKYIFYISSGVLIKVKKSYNTKQIIPFITYHSVDNITDIMKRICPRTG